MATPAVNLPPLPPGFALDAPQAQQSLPPLPAGFTLEEPAAFSDDALLSDAAMSQLAGGEPSTVTPTPERSMLDRASQYAGEYLGGLKQAAQAPGTTAQPQSFAEHLGNVPVVGPLYGAAEAALALGSGVLSPAAAFADPANPEAAARRATYEPRSAPGKAALGLIGAAAKPLTDVAEATGADVALLPLAAEGQALRTAAKGRSDLRQLKSDAKERLAPPAAPTTDELATAAKEAYGRAKDAGAVAAPQGYARMAAGVRTSLREQGFNPKLHPKAAAVVEEIEKTSSGAPVAFDELEILRRQALAAERSIEADERRVAGLIIDRLDDYADALASGAEPVMGGNAPAAVAARKEARNLYSRSRKAMEIEELQERAKVRATQFSGSGEENALRTEFRQLAMNKKRLGRFSKEEQRAIKEVAFGTPTSNTLRQLGKLAPTGGLSQWLSIGATMINPLAAAVPIAGAAARLGATRLTRNAAQRAEELMRRGPRRQEPQNNLAQLAPRSAADEAGDAFEAERAAAAAQGGIEVEELPASAVREITLKAPKQSPVEKIQAEIRALVQRAERLPADDPELLELDARYSILEEELALAKKRGKRNRLEQISGAT